ncbi:FtsB family cell division protein [Sphingomonas flavalba]|uniref:FtsB family cell division protein n=1 Tax=Sphingomonas flavalba TaxID=2559804 RepID=UPI0039DF8937
MAQKSKIRSLLRSAAGPAVGTLVIAFFGGYALVGPNGVLAYGDYSRALTERQAVLAETKARHDALTRKVALLDPKKANPDMVDELVRKELGVAHPDEIIIPLD